MKLIPRKNKSGNGSTLTLLATGTHATVQDLGRAGHLGMGVTTGGAMDPFAHRLGQRLLGNPVASASIETAWGGLALSCDTDLPVVITGAVLDVDVDGQSMPCYRPFLLRPLQVLTLGRPARGVFSYLSVAGGIATPEVLGSRSTVIREALGGVDGRALIPGDRLPTGVPAGIPSTLPVPTPNKFPDKPLDTPSTDTLTLRWLAGFQHDQVQRAALRTLESKSFCVTGARDRMGARLSGPPVETGLSQLWSEATCLGAIQVPPDGQPIVLLNDRQTMGGYPKLGAVLSPDCTRLAQAPVGTQIRFEKLSPVAADRVLWLEQNYEQELARALAGNAL